MTNLPKPIAEMGPWDFWAAARAVPGLSDADIAAIDGTSMSPDVEARAQICLSAARQALIQAPVGETFSRRPS